MSRALTRIIIKMKEAGRSEEYIRNAVNTTIEHLAKKPRDKWFKPKEVKGE